MNNNLSILFLILMSHPFLSGCSGAVTEPNKNPATQAPMGSAHVGGEKYPIDKKQTVITWEGSGFHGNHIGYVYISKGEAIIENGQWVGGSIEVDMGTIEGDDHRSDNNLINNLKGPDFFDVKKFPVAALVITSIASTHDGNKLVNGNLTIKDITHPVTLPVSTAVTGETFTANGKLVIDRTQWDIRHRSGKFFDNLKDRVIADEIVFNIKIVAEK